MLCLFVVQIITNIRSHPGIKSWVCVSTRETEQPGKKLKAANQNIDKMKNLKVDILYPAHGQSFIMNSFLGKYKKFINL
jgi:hypothetical protein